MRAAGRRRRPGAHPRPHLPPGADVEADLIARLAGRGAAETIPDLTDQVTAAQHRVQQADQHTERLYRDPAITGHPEHTTLLATTQSSWLEHTIAASRRATGRANEPTHSIRHEPYQHIQPHHGRGISR